MSADRYQSRTETIDISEGSSLISWQLKPNFKKVTISCNQNANFYIDGKIAGSGYSISRDIDYGEHSISAYYEGKSKETTITVAEGNESSVDFSFRKKRYHENYVSNDAFYMGAIYQCLNFQGAGAIMGFFAGKLNMEVSCPHFRLQELAYKRQNRMGNQMRQRSAHHASNRSGSAGSSGQVENRRRDSAVGMLIYRIHAVCPCL